MFHFSFEFLVQVKVLANFFGGSLSSLTRIFGSLSLSASTHTTDTPPRPQSDHHPRATHKIHSNKHHHQYTEHHHPHTSTHATTANSTADAPPHPHHRQGGEFFYFQFQFFFSQLVFLYHVIYLLLSTFYLYYYYIVLLLCILICLDYQYVCDYYFILGCFYVDDKCLILLFSWMYV